MAHRALLFAIAAIVSTCGVTAGKSDASAQDDIVSYACSDVVIIGHVRYQTFTPISDAGDLVGHGHIDMTIDVKRKLAGDIAATTIPASGIAHTFIREDRDFLLVLRPAPEGRYALQQGRILESGDEPSLAKDCR